MITLIYLVYVMGIFLGPVSGRISNRFGGGNTLVAGSLILGITGAGFGFEYGGWNGVIYCVAGFLVIPLFTGIVEKRASKNSRG